MTTECVCGVGGGVQVSNPRLSSTVDAHYSGTLNLWICPLVKIYLQPPNQHSWHFPSHSQTCVEWQEMWITHLMYTVSAMVEQGDILPYCFKSHVINKCPFWGLVSATFFNFDAFYWCCCYLKITPKYNIEVQSTIPKLKEALLGLTEINTCVRYTSFRPGFQCCWLWVKC